LQGKNNKDCTLNLGKDQKKIIEQFVTTLVAIIYLKGLVFSDPLQQVLQRTVTKTKVRNNKTHPLLIQIVHDSVTVICRSHFSFVNKSLLIQVLS
jgi:hypothetical protein